MLSDFEATSQDLLPGIPNEIILHQITTKLSWRDFYILSLVSRPWCQAIRSRQVYNARVLHQSTEPLILLNYVLPTYCNRLALYSTKDSSCCELPVIPDISGGFFEYSQSLSLDGKIYMLGGGYLGDSCKLYVLDLVGQRQWKQCASTILPWVEFGCNVMNGKIYIFGVRPGRFSLSLGSDAALRGSEVYDPKENTWSQVRPMTSLHPSSHAEIVGEEFLVWNSVHNGVLEVYNPAKDEWREIPCPQIDRHSLVFVAHSKLHEMHDFPEFDIKVHNSVENSWTLLHSSTFASLGPVDLMSFRPLAILAVNDELFGVVSWWERDEPEGTYGCCLVQSSGLGSKTKMIRWQTALELTLSLNGLVPRIDQPGPKFLLHSSEL